jgi:hypothetical protein
MRFVFRMGMGGSEGGVASAGSHRLLTNLTHPGRGHGEDRALLLDQPAVFA